MTVPAQEGSYARLAALAFAATAFCGCGGGTSRPHDGGAGLADATVAPDRGVVRAENTPDGLYQMTLEQATALELGACDGLSLGTDGGVSCDITPPTPPAGLVIDPTRVNVVYADGAGNYYLVLLNSSAACDRGWQFADASQSLIHICQITCDLILANPQATVSLMFGCSGPPLPM